VHPGSGLLTILEACRSATYFIGQDFPVSTPTPIVAAL